MLDGKNKKNIQRGQYVAVILKKDQETGELTEGFVRRILTKSSNHPHGIKVLLDSGAVGRVQQILDEEEEY